MKLRRNYLLENEEPHYGYGRNDLDSWGFGAKRFSVPSQMIQELFVKSKRERLR